MLSFAEIKGRLLPRLDGDGFNADNLEEIAELCRAYFSEVATAHSRNAKRDTGMYLVLNIAEQLHELWEQHEPMREDLRDSLRDNIWPHFQQFCQALLNDADANSLFSAAQKTLIAIFPFS